MTHSLPDRIRESARRLDDLHRKLLSQPGQGPSIAAHLQQEVASLRAIADQVDEALTDATNAQSFAEDAYEQIRRAWLKARR